MYRNEADLLANWLLAQYTYQDPAVRGWAGSRACDPLRTVRVCIDTNEHQKPLPGK